MKNNDKLFIYHDYRMLCPTLPAGRCKKCVNVSKNIRPFLARRGKMFSSSHYVPDGTLVDGGILLFTNMLSLMGQKTMFPERNFQKKRILHFYTPFGG